MHAVDPWKHQSSTMEACKLQSYGSTGSGLVVAIQQLYKLLYKSCIEAKQNNAHV